MTTDCGANLFCGIAIQWDYKQHTNVLSMPGYIKIMIHRIQQDMIVSKEYAPHPHQSPKYGAKVQIYLPPDDAIPLHDKFIYRNKETVGTELYYYCAVESIKIVSPIDLSTEQIKFINTTAAKTAQFINYCDTHDDDVLDINESNMNLKIHPNASHLNKPKACSQPRGDFYSSNYDDSPCPHM